MEKSLKLCILAVELASIYGALFLTWCGDFSTEDSWVTKVFISLFVLLAVAMQKEWSYWDFMDEENEES